MFYFDFNRVLDYIGGRVKNISKIRKITCKDITNFVIDDRLVTKNSAFVAIKGKQFDGHRFAKSAIKKGASFIVTEKEIPNLPQIIVKNTREAFLKIAALNKSYFKGLTIGITGSVGKTTTKEMIASILEQNLKVLKTKENENNEIGLSKTLLKLDSSYEAAVVELGMNHLGEISALSKSLKPNIGVITFIGTAHIENLGSKENILKAKLEILDGMQNGSYLVINSDNEKLKNLNIPNINIVQCGLDSRNYDYFAKDIKQEYFKTTFKLFEKGKFLCKISIPTIGKHNISNAVLAAASCRIANLDPSHISTALANFKPTGMRQNIFKLNDVTVIGDCYNANPDSMVAALKVLKSIQSSGKKIAVLGDMLELGEFSKNAHLKIGNFAASIEIDYIFCYGKLSKYIYEGIQNYKNKNNLKKFEYFDCEKNLIESLKNYIKPGDIALFKASNLIKLDSVINCIFKM